MIDRIKDLYLEIAYWLWPTLWGIANLIRYVYYYRKNKNRAQLLHRSPRLGVEFIQNGERIGLTDTKLLDEGPYEITVENLNSFIIKIPFSEDIDGDPGIWAWVTDSIFNLDEKNVPGWGMAEHNYNSGRIKLAPDGFNYFCPPRCQKTSEHFIIEINRFELLPHEFVKQITYPIYMVIFFAAVDPPEGPRERIFQRDCFLVNVKKPSFFRYLLNYKDAV